jgi:hypothetical protein
MVPQLTTATQTVPKEEEVVYFHAGSKLSYRKVQTTPGGKGSFTSIPVIDISQIDSASLDDRKIIARQLYDSCSTSGFFYIANHGVCLAANPICKAIDTHQLDHRSSNQSRKRFSTP